MNDVLSRIKILPVAVISDAEKAIPLAEAILNGGINAIEVTFRTDCAARAVESISSAFPDMLVGAGTILNIEQAEKALKAGAKFVISPGFSGEIADFCKNNGVLYVPGCVTPTEIMAALSYGITTVKFFPASVYGGVKAIRALAAPFNGVNFIPTGGVSRDNLAEFLAFNRIVAVGASYLVADKLVKDGDFAEIERLCAEAVAIAESVR